MKIAKKQLEVAGILHLYGDDYKQNRLLPLSHKKVIHHLKACRTSQLGGHVEACTECGFEKIAYNSCRDRHCPKCQTMTKEQWINDRKAELLPCGYFQTSSWLRRANLIDKLFAFGMSEEIKPRRAYFSHPFLPSLKFHIKQLM